MNIDNKETFNPNNNQHKKDAILSLEHSYWANKRFKAMTSGYKITPKIKRRILKHAVAFAHNQFNKFKKEFISK